MVATFNLFIRFGLCLVLSSGLSYLLHIVLEESGAQEIARRSRGTPRIANRLLKRVRDFAEIMGRVCVDQEMAGHALELLEVDHRGLDSMDRLFLSIINDKFAGGPVGLDTL